MSEQITLTIPAIDESAIATLETEKTLVAESEVTALAALREKYAPFARHNGFVRLAWYSQQTSNYSTEREEFYRDAAGRKVRAFLVVDDFGRDHHDQNRGSLTGTRLYLTAAGEWLELERVGHWTQWQGEAQYWGCGVDTAPGPGYEDPDTDAYGAGGCTRVLSNDAVAASKYSLSDVVVGLGKAIAGLSERIPERLAKVRQRAVLAEQLLAALTPR